MGGKPRKKRGELVAYVAMVIGREKPRESSEMVMCASMATRTIHIRSVDVDIDTITLCGRTVAWDLWSTDLKVTCKQCLEVVNE